MALCSFFGKPQDDPHRERRGHILSAAARCFVRAGFHRSTMQDVAAEARMSAGNVYRYFPSKDAVVAGLVARDRAEATEQFEALVAGGGSLEMFEGLLRRHVLEGGRDKAALWLEICAEAARNPAIAAVTRAHEAEILRRLTAFFRLAIDARPVGAASGAPPDPRAVGALVVSLFSGLMFSVAMSPSAGEAERRISELLAIVRAAIEGRIPLAADLTQLLAEEAPAS